MDWIEHLSEPIECAAPGGAQLLVHQFLCFLKIPDPGKTVFQTMISNARSIHLSGEPLASVEADLDVEGEPGLNPGIHEAELRIYEVVVQEEAFPLAKPEIQLFGFGIRADLVTHAGLDASKDSDEAFADTILRCDPFRHCLLVCLTGAQVVDRPFLSQGCLTGG